jgi:hypothetical protein
MYDADAMRAALRELLKLYVYLTSEAAAVLGYRRAQQEYAGLFDWLSEQLDPTAQ